jgi:hypothetical protein
MVTKSVVLVDTDNDGNPDTYLPGTSNFAAGWTVDATGQKAVKQTVGCHCEWATCAHQHCLIITDTCDDSGLGGNLGNSVPISVSCD